MADLMPESIRMAVARSASFADAGVAEWAARRLDGRVAAAKGCRVFRIGG